MQECELEEDDEDDDCKDLNKAFLMTGRKKSSRSSLLESVEKAQDEDSDLNFKSSEP